MNSTSRTNGRSSTTKVTFTPPSKSSTLSWTSSKNPRLKIERRSSEAWEGLKGSPTAERTRFRMTASWTRRFPSMVSSLIRIGGGAGAPGRGCASAGETRKASAAKATTNGRPTHPREVTGRQTLAVRRLVLSKLERRVCGRGLRFAEHEAAALHVDLDPGAVDELAADDGFRQRVLDVLLDGPAKLPGAVRGIVALLDQGVFRRRREDQFDALLGELLVDARDHQSHDGLDVRLGQRMEHDDVVDPVHELRPERALHLFHHALFHLVVRLLVGLLEEARRGPLADDAGAEVRRHDQDAVLEVHHVAERVAQAAVVEHLQEHVEDVRVGLFDLVEQHHRIRAPADLLGQIAALLVPHVAGGRAEQARDRELLHVLRHVDADERVLVAEQVLGEGA